MKSVLRVFAAVLYICIASPSFAQDEALSFATVERAPFAMRTGAGTSGFSVELMQAIGTKMDLPVTFEFYDTFPAMLSALEEGLHDGAVANISVTSEREAIFDFSQPIFEGGIGVLLRVDSGGNPILAAILTRDFLIAVVAALALLFGSGMLMWVFERRVQPYFDREGRDAMFPAFWWALNLVVNGGFEERMPQSRFGRMFGVVLVISSLFLVSIFVATITAAMTINALGDTVDSINDLEGRTIGTIEDSTSAQFLETRDMGFISFASPNDIFVALEAGDLEAVVFDAPILAYYSNTSTSVETRLLPRIYRSENYGIALQAGSPIAEEIDRALLELREDGSYSDLVIAWFGRP